MNTLRFSRSMIVTILLVCLAACGGSSTPSLKVAPTQTATGTFIATPTPEATATTSSAELSPSQAITVAPEISTWLRENAIAFDTTDPNSDFKDLMPLKKLIGDARIVALGESTHGTHEFFEMKHRMLRFLVEELGFNIFAIEANWPEADLVNDYVQTGQGDPVALLHGLKDLTWDTQEVLDMIRWMRAHNENPGDAPLVSFAGFDMQFFTMAMDNVGAYLEEVDPDSAAQITALFHCFRQYSDRELIYAHLAAETRTACRANLQAVYDQLSQQQSDYAARSSPEEFAQALHNARLVLQAEHASSSVDESFMLRDRYMADNVDWLLDQAGPEAKIVLWAHNYHVSKDFADSKYFADSKPMGGYLRERYGDQLVVFGFSFYQGSFSALNSPTAFSVISPPENSYEYTFHSAGLPRFFLDLRELPSNSPATNWLLTPHLYRHIGARYDPSTPEQFFLSGILPKLFDAIIYFQDTSPSLPLY